MPVTLACPMCGHPCNLAEPAGATEIRCPACFSLFPARPAAASPLLARSAAAAPPPAPAAINRTMLGEPEAMIHYSCPRCKKSLESPASFAGQKMNCPDCKQRLQIPQPSSAPAVPGINKTILATEEPTAGARPPSSRPAAPPPPPVPVVELVEEAPPARRESCLECGLDISRRSRVQTCPDCGSLFCSAGCYREHHRHAHDRKPAKRPRPVECDECGSRVPPRVSTQISQGGWIVFIVLLFFFFPLCWIGLLMTETEYHCRDCGARL